MTGRGIAAIASNASRKAAPITRAGFAVAELVDVGARRERLLAPGDDDRLHLRVGGQLARGVADRTEHGPRQRVHRRPVELQLDDTVVGVVVSTCSSGSSGIARLRFVGPDTTYPRGNSTSAPTGTKPAAMADAHRRGVARRDLRPHRRHPRARARVPRRRAVARARGRARRARPRSRSPIGRRCPRPTDEHAVAVVGAPHVDRRRGTGAPRRTRGCVEVVGPAPARPARPRPVPIAHSSASNVAGRLPMRSADPAEERGRHRDARSRRADTRPRPRRRAMSAASTKCPVKPISASAGPGERRQHVEPHRRPAGNRPRAAASSIAASGCADSAQS